MVRGRRDGQGGIVDPSWHRPRVAAFVAAAVVVVLVAGVGSIVRYRLGYPLSPLQSLGRDSTPEGRRELRALRREPLLGFRTPGTRLRETSEAPAGKDWWNADQSTEIRQRFDVEGEPGEPVDAYRARAQAGGWRLVDTTCSFHLRSTSVTLTRQVAGRPATLEVYGHLRRPPPGAPRPGLLVTITGEAPSGAPGPQATNLRRHNVGCLRSFDPTDPSLAAPAVQPGSPEAICGLLDLAEARRVVPRVNRARPTANGSIGCRYDAGEDAADSPGFGVVAAPEPRAYYEDRRSAQDPGDGRYVLLEDIGSQGRLTGAWVDTRIGPVRIHGGPGPRRPGLDAAQLAALSDLLTRR